MSSKLMILLASLLTFVSTATANSYSSKTITELTNGSSRNERLISLVKSIASNGFKPLGYKREAKNYLFGQVDLKKDDYGYYLWDVYCNRKVYNLGGTNNIGPLKVPRNKVINAEHTWPQSKGAKSEPARGDIHHLFPTDSKANSVRGNLIFGEVKGSDAHSRCSASQRGYLIHPITGQSTRIKSFQPPYEHRGNVARALFYFAAKYKKNIQPLEEAYLRKWHVEDPVDKEEIARNDRVEIAQGNRNPFIDFPQIVDRIQDF